MQANALLQTLEETFPPTNPNPDDTMEKIMYRSGQRSVVEWIINYICLLYTSPSPRDGLLSRMPSSA